MDPISIDKMRDFLAFAFDRTVSKEGDSELEKLEKDATLIIPAVDRDIKICKALGLDCLEGSVKADGYGKVQEFKFYAINEKAARAKWPEAFKERANIFDSPFSPETPELKEVVLLERGPLTSIERALKFLKEFLVSDVSAGLKILLRDVPKPDTLDKTQAIAFFAEFLKLRNKLQGQFSSESGKMKSDIANALRILEGHLLKYQEKFGFNPRDFLKEYKEAQEILSKDIYLLSQFKNPALPKLSPEDQLLWMPIHIGGGDPDPDTDQDSAPEMANFAANLRRKFPSEFHYTRDGLLADRENGTLDQRRAAFTRQHPGGLFDYILRTFQIKPKTSPIVISAPKETKRDSLANQELSHHDVEDSFESEEREEQKEEEKVLNRLVNLRARSQKQNRNVNSNRNLVQPPPQFSRDPKEFIKSLENLNQTIKGGASIDPSILLSLAKPPRFVPTLTDKQRISILEEFAHLLLQVLGRRYAKLEISEEDQLEGSIYWSPDYSKWYPLLVAPMSDRLESMPISTVLRFLLSFSRLWRPSTSDCKQWLGIVENRINELSDPQMVEVASLFVRMRVRPRKELRSKIAEALLPVVEAMRDGMVLKLTQAMAATNWGVEGDPTGPENRLKVAVAQTLPQFDDTRLDILASMLWSLCQLDLMDTTGGGPEEISFRKVFS